jgi:hypothetical protein
MFACLQRRNAEREDRTELVSADRDLADDR